MKIKTKITDDWTNDEQVIKQYNDGKPFIDMFGIIYLLNSAVLMLKGMKCRVTYDIFIKFKRLCIFLSY